MDQHGQPIEPDDPASAFAALRGEVSLLRRAVEGLAAERQNAPDYTATLAATAARLSEIAKFMVVVAQSPAVRLAPDAFAQEIAKASEVARAGDRENISRAAANLRSSIVSIDGIVEQAWSADRQKRWLLGTGVGAALIGIILGMFVPGTLARAMPASWHLPEQFAADLFGIEAGAPAQCERSSLSRSHPRPADRPSAR